MIHVDRARVEAPEVLRSDRANLARERIVKLLSGSKGHRDQLRITPDVRIYKETKPALLRLFHGKCAYCESPLEATGQADVEHFRPKQMATNLDGAKDQHHYAWLAYDWDNLLLACVNCNRSKRERFPVIGSRAKLLANVAECRSAEDSQLLDPCFDHPEHSLAFEVTGLCRPLDARGEVTIELLDLNRDALVGARRNVWKNVQRLVNLQAEYAAASSSEFAIGELRELLSESAPYLATARAAADVTVSAPRASAPVRVSGASGTQSVRPAPAEQFRGKAKLPPHAHHLIQRVEIHNFKGIEHLELDLPEAPRADEELAPAIVLLGENSCGKSTVLEAIALTLLGTRQIEALKLDAADFIRRTDWDAPVDGLPPAEVTLHFADGAEPVRLSIDSASLTFEGTRDPSTIVLGYGPRRFFTDRRRRASGSAVAERVRTMFDPLSVIENPTHWLMNAKQSDFDAAVRALRQILLLDDEAVVARPPAGKRRGQQIMFEVQGESAPLKRLSEGYKTIVATGVDVIRAMLEYWPDLETAKGVVLIDELETHLHPRWKMRIVRRLRRAMPQVQFIATTHDPLCLRGLFDGEAQVLQRDEERRVEKLVQVPNVRGLSVEQLLTSEFFGLYSTEDPGLEEDVARYAALVAKQNKSPEDEQALALERAQVQSTMKVGANPVDQLVYEAGNEYQRLRQRAPAGHRPQLRREAIEKVVGLWQSLGAAEEETA